MIKENNSLVYFDAYAEAKATSEGMTIISQEKEDRYIFIFTDVKTSLTDTLEVIKVAEVPYIKDSIDQSISRLKTSISYFKK